jgi:nitroimidazol reductase NimA-like FMN-containing flavoprotein (pyridoxamine 5'-phosphate oxidase superfamily)
MAGVSMNETEREAFLAEPHVAVLAIASGNERPPLAVPVFYHYQPGGSFTFFTNTQGRKSRKMKLIHVNSVLTLAVQEEQFPYKHVLVEGTVVAIDQPPTFEAPYQIARRYMPDDQARGFVEAEFSNPDTQFTLVTIRPDRWITQDLSKAG